jgi:hypothetical protein
VTLEEKLMEFFIQTLRKNKGNRTRTAKELSISVRTVRIYCARLRGVDDRKGERQSFKVESLLNPEIF